MCYHSILLCGVYYFFWVYALPKLGNYTIRQEIIDLDNGASTHRLLKVPNDELARWDETHDAVGRSRTMTRSASLEKGSDDGSETKNGTKVGEVGV